MFSPKHFLCLFFIIGYDEMPMLNINTYNNWVACIWFSLSRRLNEYVRWSILEDNKSNFCRPRSSLPNFAAPLVRNYIPKQSTQSHPSYPPSFLIIIFFKCNANHRLHDFVIIDAYTTDNPHLAML